MKHGPANHHPRCTCHLCQPPIKRVAPPPPPAQAPLFGERRSSTASTTPAPPVAPAATPPPDRNAAARATAAAAARLVAAGMRASRDPDMTRYLALRARGITRAEALRQVAEATAAQAKQPKGPEQ